MALAIDRKLLRWGTGYGLRLTVKEVEALGLRAGDPVHADLRPATGAVDFSGLPAFDFGPWPKGKTAKDLLDEDAAERFPQGGGRAGR